MNKKGNPERCTLTNCNAIALDSYRRAPSLRCLRRHYGRLPHANEVRKHAWCKDHLTYRHPGGSYQLDLTLRALAAIEYRRRYRPYYAIRLALYNFFLFLAEQFA